MKTIPDLWRRSFTGLSLMAMIIVLVLSGPVGLALTAILINGFGLWEYFRLTVKSAVNISFIFALLLSSLVLLMCFFSANDLSHHHLWLLLIPIAWLSLLRELYHPGARPYLEEAVILLGMACITLPLCALIYLPVIIKSGEYLPQPVLGCFLLIWTYDSLAYLGGNLFGKHALFRRVSPGKTWEGCIIGALAALAVALLNSSLFPALSRWQWIVAACIILITGTYGDLFKSLLKRSAAVKDSGNLLPGHGGILDRFDSLLGSLPFIFAYFQLIKG